MIKKLTFVNDLCDIILKSMIYYTIVLYLFTILDGYKINYVLPAACSLFVILSYFNNKYSKNIALFTIINVIAGVILLFLPLISNVKIMFIFIFILVLISSYITWAKREKISYITTPSIYYEFVFILCFMINSNKNVSTIIFILGIVYILLNYFTNYISNIISFMYYNANNKNFKMGEVLSVNNCYISFFYIASIVLIALAKLLKFDYVFEKIITPILLLIQKLLRLVLGGLVNNIGLKKAKKLHDNVGAHMGKLPKQESNAFMKFLTVLIKISLVLIKIFVVLLALYIVYKFIKIIFNYYKKSENPIDEVEYIENDKNKSVFSYLFKHNSKKFDNTNNGKIRKIYYKKISKLKKHIPVFNDKLTPGEIEKKINKDNYSINNLTKVYEKARYSNLECTENDIIDAKTDK